MILFRCCLRSLIMQIRKQHCDPCTRPKPTHLICFKQWTAQMVIDILDSALNLKRCYKDTHGKRLDILPNAKIMILQELNEPVLNMAVSKAATFLGAYDVSIVDQVIWEQDYNGKIFSAMSDAIFVATRTHMCIQRFAQHSSVPVLCMRSRTHGSIQSLSTVMCAMEKFGTIKSLNFAYIGAPHPVLNSYLLLCPMLGANIKFKCSCDKTPVTPLLFKASQDMCESSHTSSKECACKNELLHCANVVISGPTATNKEKVGEFKLDVKDIEKSTCEWMYFHTCPRGPEVDDNLFHHPRAQTFNSFENMQFIAAALMAKLIKNYKF